MTENNNYAIFSHNRESKIKTIVDILAMDLEQKNVLIIGCPASGKTYLTGQLKTSHKKIATDDYMHFGYEQSLYEILKEISLLRVATLIEGVQGYRLLRKGVQLNCYYPDIVIEMIISEQKMINTYRKERDARKIKYLNGFNTSHNKILSDYFALDNKQKPQWLEVFNDY